MSTQSQDDGFQNDAVKIIILWLKVKKKKKVILQIAEMFMVLYEFKYNSSSKVR